MIIILWLIEMCVLVGCMVAITRNGFGSGWYSHKSSIYKVIIKRYDFVKDETLSNEEKEKKSSEVREELEILNKFIKEVDEIEPVYPFDEVWAKIKTKLNIK